MYGVAANCIHCKVLASQVFYNAKKERVCSDCIQKEFDRSCENLNKAYDDLYESSKKYKELEEKFNAAEQKISVYDALLEQIRNFTYLIKKD